MWIFLTKVHGHVTRSWSLFAIYRREVEKFTLWEFAQRQTRNQIRQLRHFGHFLDLYPLSLSLNKWNAQGRVQYSKIRTK